MKIYEFNLDGIMLKKFFPHYRIKKKVHLLEILFETSKYILMQNDEELIVPDEKAIGKIVLYIDKMSRLFFFTENKYYSIVFPFMLTGERNNLSIEYIDIEFSGALIHEVLAYINTGNFDEKTLNMCDTLTEHYYDNIGFEEEIEQKITYLSTILSELLLIEDGYIRYDFDQEEFAKAKSEGKEHKHPLNHYDIFYSNKATFKLGLLDKLGNGNFIDLLNLNSDCAYLTK